MKVAPFGKPLKALIDSGQQPNNAIWMYIGALAWEKGRTSSTCRPSRTLILPPCERMIQYIWPVKNCDILLIGTSLLNMEYVEDVAYVLLKEGATTVSFISVDFNSIYYKRDF